MVPATKKIGFRLIAVVEAMGDEPSIHYNEEKYFLIKFRII
jgi:hypothetical protein